jgi:hypothetical protein
MKVAAGTRTMHVFGGKRASRHGEGTGASSTESSPNAGAGAPTARCVPGAAGASRASAGRTSCRPGPCTC